MFDILLFNITFTNMEVVGVCICLLFSMMAAMYKHFYKPVVVQEKVELEGKKLD